MHIFNYHTFRWNCYTSEIHQIQKLRFLGISRYRDSNRDLGWVRGGGGASAPTLPRATRSSVPRMLFSLCFRAQRFESTEILAVCRAFASAQKTTQGSIRKKLHVDVYMNVSWHTYEHVTPHNTGQHTKEVGCWCVSRCAGSPPVRGESNIELNLSRTQSSEYRKLDHLLLNTRQIRLSSICHGHNHPNITNLVIYSAQSSSLQKLCGISASARWELHMSRTQSSEYHQLLCHLNFTNY